MLAYNLINNRRRIKRFSALGFYAHQDRSERARRVGIKRTTAGRDARAHVGYILEALHATNSAATNTTMRASTSRLLRRPACAIDQPLKIPSTPATITSAKATLMRPKNCAAVGIALQQPVGGQEPVYPNRDGSHENHQEDARAERDPAAAPLVHGLNSKTVP